MCVKKDDSTNSSKLKWYFLLNDFMEMKQISTDKTYIFSSHTWPEASQPASLLDDRKRNRKTEQRKEKKEDFSLFILKSCPEDLEKQSLTSAPDMVRKLKIRNKTNWQAAGRSPIYRPI